MSNFKTSNTQKAIFLILFFIFLFFGFQVSAAKCNFPPAWNKAETCTIDIYYEDPSGGSGLDKCEYTAVSGTSPSCPTDGSWSTACSCSGPSTTCSNISIPIGPTGDCNTNGEGACKICSKATDGAGNTGYGELSLNVDYTAPETTIECNGTICSAGWYNADISITLSCSDNDSGCDKTYYCIDQSNSCTSTTLYTGVFNLTTEGINYVRYYSTDIAGNVEPTKSKTIKLDKTGPKSELTDVATPPAGSTVTSDFNVSVNDWDRPLEVDNSGLSNCYCSVYDSGVGWTKSGETRNCSSDLSFTVTVSPTGDCQTIGGTCTVYVYAYDVAGNPGDGESRTFNIAAPSFICNISVPTTGVIGQWIEINVSGSQGAIASVKFSSDNNLNGFPDGSWDGPYDWNISSGNWNATSKTMKWSFAEAGNYEVWVEIEESGGSTASCYDTIIIMECYPGQEDTCQSSQGCTRTIYCQADGSWPDCPVDECEKNTPNSPDCPFCPEDRCVGPDWYDYPYYGITDRAHGDCNGECQCNTDTRTGQPCEPNIEINSPNCSEITENCFNDIDDDEDGLIDCQDPDCPPTISCDICNHLECNALGNYDWVCQLDPAGTDCGDCRECDEVGNCEYICTGDVNTSCECISDVCKGCIEIYDGGCGYQGICHCGPLEVPSWSCIWGSCSCVCQYDSFCEWEPDGYPQVIISPPSQEGTPGDELFYEVTVINPSEEEVILTITASVPSDWDYWLDTLGIVEVTIGPGQSVKIPLRVKSPAEGVPSGEYIISVIAQNEDFGTGYAKYEVPNQPPYPPSPQEVAWDHCSVKAISIPTFHWTYSDPEGDPQAAYEIRIKNNSNFPSTPSEDEFTASGGASPFFSPLPYGWRNWMDWDTDYWWIVRVKDSNDNWSEEWSDPSQFRTPLHAAPWPDFTPSPNRVSLNQVVTFEDNSKCYTFPENNEFKCQDIPLPSYQWDFDYIEPVFTVDDWTKGNANIAYGDFRNYKVKLRITDDIDTCYSETETVTVTRPLPEWMEIPPF